MKFSANITKRLLQSKQIFLHGKNHSLRNAEIDRLFAILSIDQSIEYFLHVVISEYNVTLKNSKNPINATFKEIVDAANSVGKKKLPLQTTVLEIHQLRNSSQHIGAIPSESDVEKSIIYGEDFLKQSFELFFDRNYDEVFLSDIIIAEDVRTYFKEAEIAFSANKLKEAMVFAKISFNLMRGCELKKLPYRDGIKGISNKVDDIIRNILNREQLNRGGHNLNRLIKAILSELDYLHNRIDILSVGGSLHDFNLFERITPIIHYFGKVEIKRDIPYVFYFGDDKFEIIYTRTEQQELNKSDCSRVMDFVYTSIVNSQYL